MITSGQTGARPRAESELPKKLFGIYKQKVKKRRNPLVRGFDDEFYVPQSRYTEISADKIHSCKELTVLAESDEAGVLLAIAKGGAQVFVQGHFEYDRYTLDEEYRRDIEKGLDIDVPLNYYPNDDPERRPMLQWRAHGNTLYSNWLNYFVYQNTPYNL